MSRLTDEISAMLAIDNAGRLRPPLPGNVRRILAEAGASRSLQRKDLAR